MKKPASRAQFHGAALALIALASAPADAGWLKSYGTASTEVGGNLIAAPGGGYWLQQLSGSSLLFSGLSSTGQVAWTRKLSASGAMLAYLSKSASGKLLLTGSTAASASALATAGDAVWAAYTVNAATGALAPLYQKTYAGPGNDALAVMPQGSALLGIGFTTSFNANPSSTDTDALIAKINATTGMPTWSKALHSGAQDTALQLVPASAAYIFVGLTGNSGTNQRPLIGKLNASTGATVAGSFKTFGDKPVSTAHLTALAGGGYLLHGTYKPGTEIFPGTGISLEQDIFIIKLNASLAPVWSKRYSGSVYDALADAGQIKENSDGTLTLTGTLSAMDLSQISTPNLSALSPLALKLDADGNLIWSKSFGYAPSLSGAFLPNADGSYRFSGQAVGSSLANSHVLYGKFDADLKPVWVKRLNATGGEAVGLLNPLATGYSLAATSPVSGASDTLAGVVNAQGGIARCALIADALGGLTETAPLITASPLNWTAKAAAVTARAGGIAVTNVAIAATPATLTVTNRCSGN